MRGRPWVSVGSGGRYNVFPVFNVAILPGSLQNNKSSTRFICVERASGPALRMAVFVAQGYSRINSLRTECGEPGW